MATRDIRTAQEAITCDICGRTLLRGETAEIYIAGGGRRSVCELCSPRALQEGWVREGAGTAPASRGGADRRRSLFGRIRDRLDATLPADDEGEAPAPRERERRPTPAPAVPQREPRHVHAVPTSDEQKIVTAVQRFNRSEHPRTVAGVARSLGAPTIAARPTDVGASTVQIVVSWELCWYRYEVDLGDDGSSVRQVAQGYELEELEPEEQVPVATADERGLLAVG
jgi:hypothetical protein